MNFTAIGKALVLAAALFGLAAPAVARTAAPLPDDMSLGNPHAKVTVVEYASASCPHCARFNNNVFPEFKKRYIDTGKVHYVLREYLTQPVEIAAAGFLLARCAGKDKYFRTLDEFFHGQEQMYQTGDAMALIIKVGTDAGLSNDQIKTCLSDDASQKALNDRVEKYATVDKVESTPTFVVNGVKLPESDHEVNLADLGAAIDPLLGKAKGR
jgi:protein-disulfide isomerase